MTEYNKLYKHILELGRSDLGAKHDCGPYKKQLQQLHDFIYVVESTPNPCDETYSPMFLECIIHKSLCTSSFLQHLKDNHISFSILNYNKDDCIYYYTPDTEKRRLLFEMMGKWWFFEKSFSPATAKTEAIEFRKYFFRQPFYYLPTKFRRLVKEKGFCLAIETLTDDEHMFLNRLTQQIEQQSTFCYCIPRKKSSFSIRLKPPICHDVPELEIYERKGTDVKRMSEAVESGDFLYLSVYNFYDGLDRSLYEKLYRLFQEESLVNKVSWVE